MLAGAADLSGSSGEDAARTFRLLLDGSQVLLSPCILWINVEIEAKRPSFNGAQRLCKVVD